MRFTVGNEKELIEKVYSKLKGQMCAPLKVALIGDLGAGKTALVRGLCKRLGVKDVVTSPTFVIRREYMGSGNLSIQHLDLYRLPPQSDDQEIIEYIEDEKYLTFIEWPENIRFELENYDVVIKILNIGDEKRKVQIS